MLEKILKECIRINKKDGLDCFFRFFGHVNNVEIQINKDAEYKDSESDEILYLKSTYFDGELKNIKKLKLILEDLKKI